MSDHTGYTRNAPSDCEGWTVQRGDLFSSGAENPHDICLPDRNTYGSAGALRRLICCYMVRRTVPFAEAESGRLGFLKSAPITLARETIITPGRGLKARAAGILFRWERKAAQIFAALSICFRVQYRENGEVINVKLNLTD